MLPGVAGDVISADTVSVNEAGEDPERILTYHDAEDPVPILSAKKAQLYAERGTLPASYSSVAEGKVPSLKDQGSYGSCWAFSAIGACEAGLIGQGYATTSVDLSERHLAGWAGLVNEAEAPYEYFGTPLADSIPQNVYGCGTYHLQNAYIINKSNQSIIKELIMEYGSMAASYYSSYSTSYDQTMPDDYGCYYYDQEMGTNHAIQIVGWDDNFSRNNFAITPEGDGAIIRWDPQQMYIRPVPMPAVSKKSRQSVSEIMRTDWIIP